MPPLPLLQMWNSGPNEQFKALFDLIADGSLRVNDAIPDLVYGGFSFV